MKGRREEIVYVICVQPYGKEQGKPDFLATVDVIPESPTYSTVRSKASGITISRLNQHNLYI